MSAQTKTPTDSAAITEPDQMLYIRVACGVMPCGKPKLGSSQPVVVTSTTAPNMPSRTVVPRREPRIPSQPDRRGGGPQNRSPRAAGLGGGSQPPPPGGAVSTG